MLLIVHVHAPCNCDFLVQFRVGLVGGGGGGGGGGVLDHAMIPGRGATAAHRSVGGWVKAETNFTSSGVVTFTGTLTLP